MLLNSKVGGPGLPGVTADERQQQQQQQQTMACRLWDLMLNSQGFRDVEAKFGAFGRK